MRFQYRAAGPIVVVSLLALLTGCSRTQQDWRVAQQAGTAQAYQVFVTRHPDSELAGVARQRIAQLTEQAAWDQAKRANTAAAYQAYLAKYPQGVWSQDARIRMESGSLTRQETQAADEGKQPGAGTVAAQHPDVTAGLPRAHPVELAARNSGQAPTPGTAGGPVPRDLPAPAATVDSASPAGIASPSGRSARFAVQLGAFSSSARAKAAGARLSVRFRAELGGRTVRVVPVSVSGRRLYRLEASVSDRAAARRLCRTLQRYSQGCLPVP